MRMALGSKDVTVNNGYGICVHELAWGSVMLELPSLLA